MLGFVMLDVRCSLMWNVTHHNWGNLQPLTVIGSSEVSPFCIVPLSCRFVPELVTTYHVTWGTSLDCSVMIILAEYVLCLQFKKRQYIISPWKVDIRSFSYAISIFNGTLTFISKLKIAFHCGPMCHYILYIYIYFFFLMEYQSHPSCW